MPAEECEALLHRAQVLRLGIADAEGPYVVPVNYGYEGGRIYVHGASEGRRIAHAAAGGRVCFEVDEGEVVPAERPCGFTSRFSSVIGYGAARLAQTEEEKRAGLDVIMRHYGSTAEAMPREKVAITSVVVIDVDTMDGKWHLVTQTEA